MEHIRDLDNAVSQIRGLLREGGRVYIDVPDAGRFTADADAPFQEFSTEHINFFSTRSLSNLMCLRGSAEEVNWLPCALAMRTGRSCGCLRSLRKAVHTIRDAVRLGDRSIHPQLCGGLPCGGRCCARQDRQCSGSRRADDRLGSRNAHPATAGYRRTEERTRVSFFVDSNPNYQRQQLCGLPVVSPSALHSRDPILISSRGFQREIQHQIQHELGLENRLILLYN